MSEPRCIGIDFGTDSVRVVVVRADTGAQEAHSSAAYPRWTEGRYCDAAASQFRQHPLDYLDSLERACQAVSAQLSGAQRDSIIGIGVDTTASTVCAVDEAGTPLALGERFADNPNAMFVLWKDHTALRESREINTVARTWGGIDYTCFSGGAYSPEWFWAKALHVLRTDAEVADAACSWTEHCDWIPGLLTGATAPGQLRRGRAAAGHKAMWHESWGGLPSADFLARLDPRLAALRGRLYDASYPSDQSAGPLTGEWAGRLGLPAGITVAVGGGDAHLGAVGGGVRPGTVAKILGTSTCDMIVADADALGDRVIAGICGQVDGSIVPGLIGLEAGQSAYGDVYAWFRDLLCWPLRALPAEQREAIGGRLLDDLSDAAEALPVDPGGILSLDWFNGRRTPNANPGLKAAITGLSLGADAPRRVPLPGRSHRLRQPRHQRAPGRRRHPGGRDHRARRHLATLRLRRAGGRRRARHADQRIGHRRRVRPRRGDVRGHGGRPLRHRAGGAGRHGARLQDHLRAGPRAGGAIHRRLPALPRPRRSGGVRPLAPRHSVAAPGRARSSASCRNELL